MRRCSDCVHFYVHPVYTNMGFCEIHRKLVDGQDSCDRFSEVRPEEVERGFRERGWIYCTDCRKPLFELSEVKEHLRLNHHLTIRFLRDQVAKEESPGAF
ncbi:MAG: hypothetical protein ACP5GH_04590 [Nitrososphaeria archaeon]|jgi:hypothetical protein